KTLLRVARRLGPHRRAPGTPFATAHTSGISNRGCHSFTWLSRGEWNEKRTTASSVSLRGDLLRPTGLRVRAARGDRGHGYPPRNEPPGHAVVDPGVHVRAARARRHHERPRPRHHGAERRAESEYRRRAVELLHPRLARRRPVRRRRMARRFRLPADELHRDGASRGAPRPAR